MSSTSEFDLIPTIEPGDVIADRYQIVHLIGEGGMAAVYAARDRSLGRVVAIKFLHAEHCANPLAVKRFVDEGRAVAQLQSEHLAAVFDVGTWQGTPYLVMEHLRGRDLGDLLLMHGQLEATQAEWFVLQACEGIAVVHRQGIVHRDIKPDNLYVAKHGDGRELLKILDFGISKLPHGAPVESNQTLGSPDYMSPEQAQNADSVDARSDIWSLGAVLYELVTGRRPFDGGDVTELLHKVVTAEPAPVLDLAPATPASTVAIIERCLAKSPDDRFGDVHELASALAADGAAEFAAAADRVARGLGVTLEDGGTLRPIAVEMPDAPAAGGTRRPRASTHRRGWITPAIAVVAAGIVGGVYFGSRTPPAYNTPGAAAPSVARPAVPSIVEPRPDEFRARPAVKPPKARKARAAAPARRSRARTPVPSPSSVADAGVKRTAPSGLDGDSSAAVEEPETTDAAQPEVPSQAASGIERTNPYGASPTDDRTRSELPTDRSPRD